MGQTDGALRVVYVPPDGSGRTMRFGLLVTLSGVSALVQFDGCQYPQWVPLARLHKVKLGPAGWQQLEIWSTTEVGL